MNRTSIQNMLLILGIITLISSCGTTRKYTCSNSSRITFLTERHIEKIVNSYEEKVKALERALVELDLPTDSIKMLMEAKAIFRQEFRQAKINSCSAKVRHKFEKTYKRFLGELGGLKDLVKRVEDIKTSRGIGGVGKYEAKRYVENFLYLIGAREEPGGGIYLDWPLPLPSARYKFTSKDLDGLEQLSLVDSFLIKKFNHNGYDDYTYFYIKDIGVALITKPEQIDKEGNIKYESRFDQSGFSRITTLSSYFRSLFFGVEGIYRNFIFIISEKNFTTSARSTSISDQSNLVLYGLHSLPNEFIKDNGKLTLICYVYEFHLGIDSRNPTNEPSKISGKEHLLRAGFIED